MHLMIDFVMSVSYGGVLMENLEVCMQQGLGTIPTTTRAPCNASLSMVERYTTTFLR